MLNDGRRLLHVHVRPAVFAAVERLAARGRMSKQTICERAIEGAVELEIEREFKPAAENVAKRPYFQNRKPIE